VKAFYALIFLISSLFFVRVIKNHIVRYNAMGFGACLLEFVNVLRQRQLPTRASINTLKITFERRESDCGVSFVILVNIQFTKRNL